MFKSTTSYTVSITTRMPEIFPSGLPVNAYINKGRCAIGGTTQEMKDKSRCTILTVPNISILFNKYHSLKIDERPDYIVYGDIKLPQVKEMMNDRRPGLKIMTTPEGVKKIMDAAYTAGRLTEVYKRWFLLLDESHTFITEAYRKDILIPFDYFWGFHNKSILSATPYFFSDPRFEEQLDYHEVTFTEKLGKITLVNAVSVVGTLDYLLRNVDQFPGNVHIFYNSVTAIKNAVLLAGLTDCNIFCADDKDKENFKKLGDLERFFVPEPKDDGYKKINFYTCKYFEGWDLFDKTATIVLVTDCYQPHTKIGVSSKGKQAIGRLRDKPFQIIHITNHEHKGSMISPQKYKEEYTKDAQTLIRNNNSHVKDALFDKFKSGDERLKYFADVDKETRLATINLLKLDQQINESASNEIYKNISFIKEDWERAFFEVEVQNSNMKLESKTSLNRKSASKQLQEDYEELLNHHSRTSTDLMFYFGKTIDQQIAERNPLAYKAFKLLDKELVEHLKFNRKKVDHEVVLKEKQEAEAKLLKLLKKTFTFNTGKDFYFNSFITPTLQNLYTKVGLIDPKTGKIKKASPADLGDEGRFIVQRAKRTNSQGKREYGVIIKGYQLGLKTTE